MFRAKPATGAGKGQQQLVEVLSWKVQVCDDYNCVIGKKLGACITAEAPIPIPEGISVPPVPEGAGKVEKLHKQTLVYFKDVWMAEVEAAGGAQPFELYSEVFDVPDVVRSNFAVVNGKVRT